MPLAPAIKLHSKSNNPLGIATSNLTTVHGESDLRAQLVSGWSFP